MTNPSFQLPGYSNLELIYKGSKSLVYRAKITADNKPVVLKFLHSEYPTFSELVQFRNQYTISKNLDWPGIVRSIALENYRNGFVLVMEDDGSISLEDYLKRQQVAGNINDSKLRLTEFLKIAIQLADILEGLYQNRIIHKDIKPANILIHPENLEIKLIDFSIASLLPKSTQEIQNPHVLEGTLAYLSPEQTGRMNRGIDYRSDFYNLGVTFYEILSGKLPFESSDGMELVHCHIAKMPPALRNRAVIPPVLSDIVMKLMAKNAENRYQSAQGLKYDLENCLKQLESQGRIAQFELGKKDISSRFIISEKLYGREREVQQLFESFERVSTGNSEIILVAGFSGIGKTVVVNEVHKPIVRQRGYFIKGKFDQFNRNIPLSGFVQAFRDLIGQLLTESDRELQAWKTKILGELGENGQVIIEVIPELEKIIGEQPAAVELSGSAAQNRFNLLFQKFIQVFTQKEHPLVIFLDDLQWADSASLKLMQLLMSETDSAYLLMIGAYRDNEVFPSHPLILTLDEIAKSEAIINTITLTPLSKSKLNQLVADTLICSEDLALPLSELVYHKTKGNPFFATQFLKGLHQDGLINFNDLEHCWQCDLAQINQEALTDDVVEFMALQLQKLPTLTQDVLKLAACIGNQFDLETLGIVCEKSLIETANYLWKALQEGLILPQSEVYKFYLGEHKQQVFNQENSQKITYKFLHDRVQQAAYSLITEDQKQLTHLKIGQLLLSNYQESEREDNIFDIVNQLNIGRQLIIRQIKRDELARLNLKAGRKAKTSTAYEGAIKYLTTGIKLLAPDSWQTGYELTLALYTEVIEASYLNGDFEQAENYSEFVLEQVNDILDRVKIYELKIQKNIVERKANAAFEIGLQILNSLGISQQQILDYSSLEILLPQVEDLENTPEMSNPYQLASMRILVSITSAASIAKPEFLLPIIMTQVHLSLEFGNTSLTAFSYSWYGAILCGYLGEIDKGYQAGQLALKLLEKFEEVSLKCQVMVMVYQLIYPWKNHLSQTLNLALESFKIGLENGDLIYASYSSSNYCSNLFLSGHNLDNLSIQLTFHIEALHKKRIEYTIIHISIWKQLNLNLQGLAENVYELIGEGINEAVLLSKLPEIGDTWGLFALYVAKEILLYLLGDYKESATQAMRAKEYASGVGGWPQIGVHNFYDSLSLLALYPNADQIYKQQHLKQIAVNQEKMLFWAENAPMNYRHKYDLVEAEKYRVLGDKTNAIEYYDRAITGAKENEYLQEEALANELAAKFYLEWGKEKVASAYMIEAYYCYAKWGAVAKINDLEKRYPQLLAPILQQRQLNLNPLETLSKTATSSFSIHPSVSTPTSQTISVALDLSSILKASQALSGEINLERLITTFMEILLQNSGAEKIALILPEENNWVVTAVATVQDLSAEQTIVFTSTPLDSSNDIPVKIIHSVKRTLQPTLIDNITKETTWAVDSYILKYQPQSILCSPILHQGKLIGILYLENNLVSGVFTKERMKILNLLCTQAAISLENARLYRQSQKYSQELERSLAELHYQQARFKNLVDNVPGVVYQFRLAPDGTTSISYISADCYELYEISSEKAMADIRVLSNCIHPEDVESYQQSIATVVQTLKPWDWEWRIVTPSGKVKWVRGGARLEKQPDESLVWDGVLLDISDRKQAEAQIKQKSEDLEKALQELQNAQLQLVQSEKMSALGQLMAGITHEINNPIGFVAGNLDHAEEYLKYLIQHLRLYQNKFPQPGAEIEQNAEDIELEYLLEDLPELILSMATGIKRIRDISSSMRTFSRADTNQKVAFNLDEGIDSTLLILKHRLKANDRRREIEVIKEYENLPPVRCYPGQLNQVFMNIIANAIDVFDEISQVQFESEILVNYRITIITEITADRQQAVVRIIDNGKGIPAEVKTQIFDYLFTTKPVGKGTGLGLSICRQIVEDNHGGILKCYSELGKGTEFVISIPI